jgi:Leucine-rich repeat (LRR) protein
VQVYFCRQLSGDLTPLAGLTSLQSLTLSGCEQLSDLSPLAGLTSLQSLNLSECEQLSGDLAPLAGLSSLKHLHLNSCLGIRRFAPLEALLHTLKDLRLFGCELDDLPSALGEAHRWCNRLVARLILAYGAAPWGGGSGSYHGPFGRSGSWSRR